ncbi:MAG: hypothetical protein AAF657_19415 [Acidobacteriota bacterium]
MRRPIWAYLLLFGLCATLGSLAWLTRNPQTEILDRAATWPVVGPAAARFIELYRPPGVKPPEDAASLETEPAGDQGASQAQFSGRVYVLKGQELKARPNAAAPTLYRFESHTSADKIAQRGDWYNVHYHGREGWVLLENYDETAAIPYGEETELPLPVAARPPDSERLAAARKYLRGRERVSKVGPYALYTDSLDDGLIAYLGVVAASLDRLYAERTGLRPTGTPAEAVVLYQSDIAYRLLQRQTEQIAGLASTGHNAEGVAVLYVGGRSWEAVAKTLVHEIVHCINRRAVGPQLPPWLDEGLADDLAQARIDDDAIVHPGELGGKQYKQDGKFRVEGGLSTLWQLRQAARESRMPTLEALSGMDWETFVEPQAAELHYGVASFWVRYLLDPSNRRRVAATRSFLAAVAAGKPATAQALRSKLGEDWAVLDAGFAEWIEALAERHELPDDKG